jgi:hypothetical protein
MPLTNITINSNSISLNFLIKVNESHSLKALIKSHEFLSLYPKYPRAYLNDPLYSKPNLNLLIFLLSKPTPNSTILPTLNIHY